MPRSKAHSGFSVGDAVVLAAGSYRVVGTFLHVREDVDVREWSGSIRGHRRHGSPFPETT
jgi:hypothetical protein